MTNPASAKEVKDAVHALYRSWGWEEDMNDYTASNFSNGPPSVGQGCGGGGVQFRGEASKPKTPEEIALEKIGKCFAVRSKPPSVGSGEYVTIEFADIVEALRVYGDQRAAEALREERTQTTAPVPTKLEQVADAIRQYGLANSADIIVRVALEALKCADGETVTVMSGNCPYQYSGRIVNAYLDSILAEGQK